MFRLNGGTTSTHTYVIKTVLGTRLRNSWANLTDTQTTVGARAGGSRCLKIRTIVFVMNFGAGLEARLTGGVSVHGNFSLDYSRNWWKLDTRAVGQLWRHTRYITLFQEINTPPTIL